MSQEYPFFYATYERGLVKALNSLYKIFITKDSLLGARMGSDIERVLNLVSGIIALVIVLILSRLYQVFQNFLSRLLTISLSFLIYYLLKYFFSSYAKKNQIKTEIKYKHINFDRDSFLRADKANLFNLEI